MVRSDRHGQAGLHGCCDLEEHLEHRLRKLDALPIRACQSRAWIGGVPAPDPERTKEIGLRQAVGAKTRHILSQFLVEAMTLSVLGGLLGIGLGIVASRVISRVAGWQTLVSFSAIVGAFLFSAFVGIFFGYYPARKAANLDPIDALRYE